MYSTYYSNLFWGFMLVLINIRIGGVSILPDFVGFILIYYALNKLALQHHSYGKAKPFAFMLIFLALPNIYEGPTQNLLYNPLTSQSLLLLLLGQIYVVMQIVMIYYICRAITGLAEERDLTELLQYNRSVWRFYLVVSGVSLFVTPFMLSVLTGMIGIFIALIVLMFISFIFVIHLIYRAGKELGSNTEECGEMPGL